MKKYNVIYADPPWSYDNKKVMGKFRRKSGLLVDGGAAEKYDLLTLNDLKEMPIKQISEKNSVLFLWCVNPLLPEALDLLQYWGFKYKTTITWRKVSSVGMGYWFRGETEHLLLGVRGCVKCFKSLRPNFHQCKAGRHSQKPQYFRELISESVTKSFDEPKKLELFARSRSGFFPDYEYEGWDVYGNEVNNSIVL